MYLLIKRCIDLLISGTTILVLSPLLIPVAIILRFTGEGEILYVQERVGYKNKMFGIYKFATMLKNSPNIGSGTITLPGDSRVLPFGGFLRKTKINELPQLFNVLLGDMSIVGPRPLTPDALETFPEDIRDRLYDAKPGITGIGSIVFRDEESLFANSDLPPKQVYRELIAPYKGQLELWYQENRSTLTDIKIILMTAWVIVFPTSNVIENVFPTMPRRCFDVD